MTCFRNYLCRRSNSARAAINFAVEFLENRTLLSTAAASPLRQIVGFLPGYLMGRGFDPAVYDPMRADALTKVTRLNFFALIANPDGTIPPLGVDDNQPNIPNPTEMDNTIQLAHDQHVPVSITVGGDNSASFFQGICQNQATRSVFIHNLVQFAMAHDFDGIDLDYEQPSDADVQNYGDLINELHQALVPLGMTLSVDVFADHHDIPASVIGDVDFVEVMAYNLNVGDPSGYQASVAAVQFWEAYRVPRSKLLMGIPFFGDTPDLQQKMSYGAIQHAVNPTEDPMGFLPPDQDSVTLGGVQYLFNGVNTVKAKTQFMYQNGYGGVMVFDLLQDYFDSNLQYTDGVSLLPAIKMVADQYTSPVAGSVFNDANYNGTLDPGEGGLANWTVFLDLNNNGMLDAGEPTMKTASDGTYVFNGLIPGSYSVGEVVPSTYRHTTPLRNPTAVSVSTPGQSTVGPMFGDVPICSVVLNFSYLLRLAQHYGQPATIAGGDLNDDEQVDFSDLLLLAQNYGHTLCATVTLRAAKGNGHLAGR